MSASETTIILNDGRFLLEDKGAAVSCLRCGGKFALVLPAPLSVYAAAMTEFCRIHEQCQPR